MAYNQRYRTGLVNTAPQGKRKWNPSWSKKGPTVERGSQYKPITSPTDQQLAIFHHIVNSRKSLKVKARAGTSKTSSIVEAMRMVPDGVSMLYVIFANKNAREAEGKADPRVQVSTIHSYGLAQLRRAFGSNNITVDDKGDKSYNIALALIGPDNTQAEARYNLIKAMSLAKGYMCETVEEVLTVCDKHGIEFAGMNEAEFAGKVLEGMRIALKQYMRVEFDEMISTPLALNVACQQYDIVFLDEAGDVSKARWKLVLKAVKPGGKLVFIGDDKQCIFQFTGVSSGVLDDIKEATQADELPLTMTFRCGRAIVELAKQYVPDYEAAPCCPEGEVASKTYADMQAPVSSGGATAGDFILSATNAPLVPLCLQFIREGRKCMILGKDLGKNLQWMITRSKTSSVVGFLDWLDAWKNVECEKLITRNKKCDHITDKYDTLVYLTEGTNDLAVVKQRITNLFSDNNVENIITMSTAHKSKGMERKRVFLLMETYAKMSAKATTPTDIEAQENLMYVSITRAIHSLYQVV